MAGAAGFEFEHECGFKTNKANAYAMHEDLRIREFPR